MWIVFIVFAFLAGVALPFQFGINAQLRNFIGSPYLAAVVSFSVGALTLSIFSIFSILMTSFSFNRNITEAPWWIWIGGVLGAFYVLATIILIPRIGAATTVAFVLTGQIIASILIDHFGLLNVPEHALSLPRIFGTLLIVAGVILVQKF
ncbi:DMT family transporter [Thermaerobacillus caldiproteolyticus]|uniref:DMT family transporter n=1 Tax=Thermaerobacillus caldiproteolyticus TaxID=247480 RepID=UPI00188C29E0|nr:DMT family transporter [Anoxybacillus caldiproteolyticus]QPA32545.1 DMT family transporter [Anoxybacillus caldiproteolyticus]